MNKESAAHAWQSFAGTSQRHARLLRKCACGGSGSLSGECESCRKKKLVGSGGSLQRASANSTAQSPNEVPPIVHDVLRSPGQPLDAATRAFFEPRFGHDFSRVRVHTDSRAAESARAVNALAYTVGSNVVMGSGSPSGSRQRDFVLAHELAHVVQQADSPLEWNISASRSAVEEKQASAAGWAIFLGQYSQLSPRSFPRCLQKIDVVPDFLEKTDLFPKETLLSADYIENNILEVGLREEWSGLTVKIRAVTVKYKDGSLLDIPISSGYLKSRRKADEMQVIRYRRHTPTAKIMPLTWRGKPDELPETGERPLGNLIFAEDITPNIMRGYDDAVLRRAFAFAGEMAAIWGAALGARGLAQMFSATQAAAIQAAGRGALGASTAAARAAALREAERQALEAEEKVLIAELRTAGTKFTEKEIVQIVRAATRRVVWLEKGNASAGLEHIMARHGSDFARLGIKGEGNVVKLIMETVKSKTPVRIVNGLHVYRVVLGGTEREMGVVVGSNGFVVTAYPL